MLHNKVTIQTESLVQPRLKDLRIPNMCVIHIRVHEHHFQYQHIIGSNLMPNLFCQLIHFVFD